MVARMLLPVLGGTPAVWNTCMVFFQAALLAGYGYALLISRWPIRRQLTVQLALFALALISLPLGLSLRWINSVPANGNPSLWVLACLADSDEIARVHLLPIQRSFHLTSMAHIQLQRGRIDEALDTYRAAVDLSRQARHAEGLVQSLRMLGNALFALGRYDEALPCVQEAAALFVQLEDRGSEAEMRTGIARILQRTSPGEAAQAWRVVLDLQRTRGDSPGELQAREGLACAMRERGGDAVPAFESALALAVTIGDRTRETAIRNTLGILEWERGGYAAALNHYECALALAREDGSVANTVVILNGLGASLTRLDRPDEARTVLEESLALSRTAGQRQLEAHALAALAHVSLITGDLAGAAERFEESRLLRQAIGDRAGAEAMERRLASLAREP